MIAARTLKPAIRSISAPGVASNVCFLFNSSKTAAVKHNAETTFSGVNFTFKVIAYFLNFFFFQEGCLLVLLRAAAAIAAACFFS